jgi:hypothetical protein
LWVQRLELGHYQIYWIFFLEIHRPSSCEEIVCIVIQHVKIEIKSSVAEPHNFYATPALGKNFDAAPAPAPTLLYKKGKFLKRNKF